LSYGRLANFNALYNHFLISCKDNAESGPNHFKKLFICFI